MLTSTCLKELVVLHNQAWPGVLGIRVFWVCFTLVYGILLSQYGYKVSCFPEFLVYRHEVQFFYNFKVYLYPIGKISGT